MRVKSLAVSTAASAIAAWISVASAYAAPAVPDVCQKDPKTGIYTNSSGSSSSHWMRKIYRQGKIIIFYDSCVEAAITQAENEMFGKRTQLSNGYRRLVLSTFLYETGFNPNLPGSSGEKCIGHIMEETAKSLGINRDDLVDCIKGTISYHLNARREMDAMGCKPTSTQFLENHSIGYNAGNKKIRQLDCDAASKEKLKPVTQAYAERVSEAVEGYYFVPQSNLERYSEMKLGQIFLEKSKPVIRVQKEKNGIAKNTKKPSNIKNKTS